MTIVIKLAISTFKNKNIPVIKLPYFDIHVNFMTQNKRNG